MIRRLLLVLVPAWALGCAVAWAQEPAPTLTTALVSSGAPPDPIVVALLELARVSPTGLWIALAAWLLSRRGPWVLRLEHTHVQGVRDGAPVAHRRQEAP